MRHKKEEFVMLEKNYANTPKAVLSTFNSRLWMRFSRSASTSLANKKILSPSLFVVRGRRRSLHTIYFVIASSLVRRCPSNAAWDVADLVPAMLHIGTALSDIGVRTKRICMAGAIHVQNR
jgi:hypothetical protein